METIEILKQLISIPSWVDKNNDEKEVGNWIYDFLEKNTNLKITKQSIGNGRFNIFAQNSNIVDTLLTGHIDTVQPNSGWTKKSVKPEIAEDKLYGLGSSDMKSGVAIMLKLTTLTNLNKNIAFLFYCDEEYDFLGMKTFIKNCKVQPCDIKPKLIISLDGEGMQINNSCRGLIELKVKVKGKTGHAANPKSGINAITESFKVINNLKKWLKAFRSDELGNSTLNIAYMNGGGDQGNIIAEKCEYIVEIRVANESLNAKKAKEFIAKESERLGLEIENIKIRHDLGNWITKREDLEDIFKIVDKKSVKSAKKSGYIDIQMLWQTFGKVPTFSFGVGEKGMSHKTDEYVKIENIAKAQKFFEKLLIS